MNICDAFQKGVRYLTRILTNDVKSDHDQSMMILG